jgi:tetratricopeptide (TPR) repeat protein
MLRAGIWEYREWSANSAQELEPPQHWLPEKVRRVIEARLAKLSENALELAGLAAIAGREFSYRILSMASSLGDEELMRALDELWRSRIIRERSSEGYVFSHDKIRQVAHARMSDTRRRFCHRKVAEALEKLHENHLESVSDQLAAHYELAGLFEKAIFYYQLATQTAQYIFANQQAIQLIKRSLQLLEGKGSSDLSAYWIKEKQSQLLEQLGDILARIGDYEEARQNHQWALALVEAGDHFWQARLQRKIGNDFREQVNYNQAIITYQMAEAFFDFPPQEKKEAWWWEWIELQLDQSLVYFYLSQPDEVLRIVERLKPVVEKYGTSTQCGRFYRRLVTIKFRQNRFGADDETIDLSRKALAMIKESNDLIEIASAYFGLGLALFCKGDMDEAEEQIQAALEVTQQTGQDLLPVCFSYLAVIHRKRNHIAAAMECAHRVLEITSLQKDPIYYAMAKSIYAWAAWRKQQLAKVELQAKQALSIWQELPDAFPFRWIAFWPLIGALFAQDRLADAITAAQGLFHPHQQLPPPALEATLNAAIQAWGQQHVSEARMFLHQALKQAATSGYL